MYSAPDTPLHEFWSLRSSPPLPLTKPSYLGPISVRPRESQTLSTDAAGPSVAHDELSLSLLLLSPISFCSGDSSARDAVFRVPLFYAEFSPFGRPIHDIFLL